MSTYFRHAQIITNYLRQKPIELIKYCLKDIQQLSQQPIQLLT